MNSARNSRIFPSRISVFLMIDKSVLLMLSPRRKLNRIGKVLHLPGGPLLI